MSWKLTENTEEYEGDNWTDDCWNTQKSLEKFCKEIRRTENPKKVFKNLDNSMNKIRKNSE